MADPNVRVRLNKALETPDIILREKPLLPQLLFCFLLQLEKTLLLFTWILRHHLDLRQRRIHMLRLYLARLPNPLQTLPLTLRLLRTIQKHIRRLLLRHRCKKQRFFIHHLHILLQQRIHLSICRLLTSQLRALKPFVKSLSIAFRHYHRLLSLFG